MGRFYDWREEDFSNIAGGSGAQNMTVDGSGGDVTFRVAAPANTLWVADTIVLMIQDNTGWNSGDFVGRAALANGLRIRLRDLNGATNLWGWNLKDNTDLMEKLPLRTITDFANGQTVAIWELKASDDMGFHVTDNEVLEFLVRDDLTSLTKMRAHVHYGVPG